MSTLALDFGVLTNELVSLIEATGAFDQVNSHQPVNKPGNGTTCSVWANTIESYSEGSGLSATAGLVTVNVRVFNTMAQAPYDGIDATVVNAAAIVLGVFSGSFTLSANVRNVDLMNLKGVAGYMDFGGGNTRVMTITVPMVINDVWAQSA